MDANALAALFGVDGDDVETHTHTFTPDPPVEGTLLGDLIDAGATMTVEAEPGDVVRATITVPPRAG